MARERAGLGPASYPEGTEAVAEELAQHLEDRYDDLRRQGVPEAEAFRSALDELPAGSAVGASLRREARSGPPRPPVLGDPARPAGLLSGLLSDLRYAARSLAKSPGFTAVALLTMALGIGANAVLFTVVNAVLLRPLPFADPDRLVTFWGSAPQMGLPTFNYPDAFYRYFRERSQTLEQLSAFSSFGVTLASASGEPERLTAAGVSEDFFRLLGREPQQGRGFLPEETRKGGPAVAVLSHTLWQRRFGGDPGILGRSLLIDGRPTEVVGVLPPGMAYPYAPEPTQIWFPLPLEPDSLDCWCYALVGRLTRKVHEPETARSELARLGDDFWRDRDGRPRLDPATGEQAKSVVIVQRLSNKLVSDVRTPLLVLLGAVGVVLLIACANVANLLLARAAGRTRDIALRGCLGASPWRLARQLLVESLLLAGLGAGLGLAFAQASLFALRPVISERVAHIEDVGLDGRVLLALLGVTLAVGVLFGLAPALRGARLDLNHAVKDGGRSTHGRGGRRLSQAFVVAQFALSLVLLAGAGLLLRSFRNLMGVDLGFRPENVLVGRIAFPASVPVDPERVRTLYDQLLERVSGLPGVQSLGLSSIAPFSQGDRGEIFRVRGEKETGPNDPKLVVTTRSVTGGYFAAVGTPILRGRGIAGTDTKDAPKVVVVDESLARRIWPQGDPIGKEIAVGANKPDTPWFTVVGVAASIKHGDVRAEPTRYVYAAHAQRTLRDMDLVVRTAQDPAALAGPIRDALRALDPTLPFYQVHTLQNAVADTLGTVRLTERLLAGFALAAALLAALGIYGVMALNVSHRVNEFGVRLALGASPRDVRALVLGQGLRLALVGAALGLMAAAPLGGLLKSLLFGVPPVDPPTFAAVAAGLVAVAAAACYLPARRATATDPVQALRAD